MPLDNANFAPEKNYPNIVPENNLRLPDAITIKHGPARLLSRFVLEGDKEARRRGIELRMRHDFDELVHFNKQQSALGAWYPLVDMFNPDCTELTPENAFWISGENEDGEIVLTWGARIFNWTGTNLLEQARAFWFGQDFGQPCIVTAEAAKRISGVCVCGGASWIRPDCRGKHLSRLVPRLGKAYACARWPLDWSFCCIGRSNVDKGLARNYGQRNLSYSLFYPDTPYGEQVLAYTPIEEVYDDLANFLMTELSDASSSFAAAIPEPAILEHMVTRTSSEGVFHGSISRS
jgi:hypothetical protein